MYNSKHTRSFPRTTADNCIWKRLDWRLTYSYLRTLRVLSARNMNSIRAFYFNNSYYNWHQRYILQIDLLVELLYHSHLFYKAGLAIYFQGPTESKKVYNTTSIQFLHTNPFSFPTRGPLVPKQASLSDSKIRIDVQGKVPDWTTSIRSRQIHSTTVEPENSQFYSKILIKKKKKTSSSLSNIQLPFDDSYPVRAGTHLIPASLRSTYLPRRPIPSNAKPYPTPTVRFLFKNQQDIWSHYNIPKLRPLSREWKLRLPWVTQLSDAPTTTLVDTQPSWLDTHLSRKSKQSEESIVFDVLSSRNYRAESPEKKRPILYANKSPVTTFRYETLRRSRSTYSLVQSPLLHHAKFFCLIDAATRTWIRAIQGNPFGKISILLVRSQTVTPRKN